MPPALSRKRLRSDSPEPESSSKRARTQKPPVRRSKASVFQTLDAPPKIRRTLSQTKAFLEQQDDESELSDAESSDDDFEHVPLNGASIRRGDNDSDASQADDWEDALDTPRTIDHDHGPAPVISGDIALTLSAAPKAAFDTRPDGKKGPSKIQRQIRNVTHCIHVQSLLFHNLIRNAWIQDKEVQRVLVHALPASCWREVEQYWRDAGIPHGLGRAVITPSTVGDKGKWKETGKNGVKVYESPLAAKTKGRQHASRKSDRNARDWGAASEPLEPNTPNLSAGEPLLRLLRYLSAYFKSKFRINAPSLRKRGYLSPATLEAEINAWRDSPSQSDLFGERIESLAAFRLAARKCEGSRDVGHQLFTALLRGLGIESRMVVSLQPAGFGFSQAEEGKLKNIDDLDVIAKQSKHKSTAKPRLPQGKLPQRATTSRKPLVIDSDLSDDSDLSSVISISSDSVDGRAHQKSPRARNYGEELPYPTYWTEAISHLTHTPIAVSCLPRTLVASASSTNSIQDFYARGAAADKARQVLAYVIAFSADGTAKDVTTRYLPKHQWPGRTKGFRMAAEKIPIHNKRGKVKRWEEWDWFRSVMRPYARLHDKREPWDEVEDEGDLVPAEPEKKKTMDEEGGKETLQGYKSSTEYVLKRHLRREEALRPNAKIVRHFVSGKGNKETSEPVYRRRDVVNCKTVESWHKEGREIKEGEQPLKSVPIRAVTVTRKREIEERERDEGVKPQQGLYSFSQTDWIIPPPIVDGKIPRNAFNNIDVYVPTMVPKGAVHIPLKGTARICRKLNIDYAEACTGFEFGKQRAVPVLTGVVVASEHEDMVIDAWEAEEAAKAQKEAEKREKLVLGLWKKFLSGLRIVERMKEEYGEDVELPSKIPGSAPSSTANEHKSEWDVFQNQNNFEGGFLRDGGPSRGKSHGIAPIPELDKDDVAGGFLQASQDEPIHGDLTIDHGDEGQDSRTPLAGVAYQKPISLSSALLQPDTIEDVRANEEEQAALDSQDEFSLDSSEQSRRSPSLQKTIIPPKSSRRRSSARGENSAPKSVRKRKPRESKAFNQETSPSRAVSGTPSLPQPPRTAPKRKAAWKSEAQVKSHFFAQGSDDETDLTDITDRTSPKKASIRTRGRAGKRRGGASER